jgi:hypothetical protein
MAGTSLNHFGWSGTIGAFLAQPEAVLLARLREHHQKRYGSPAGQDRVRVWETESGILRKEFKQLLQVRPEYQGWSLVLDYESSRRPGWHPDAIILAAPVFVLIFRDEERVLQAYADQLEAYAGDLHLYHPGSGKPPVVPVIVHTRAKDQILRDGGVIIISPDRIADFLAVEAELEAGPLIDAAAWIAAAYPGR